MRFDPDPLGPRPRPVIERRFVVFVDVLVFFVIFFVIAWQNSRCKQGPQVTDGETGKVEGSATLPLCLEQVCGVDNRLALGES